MALVFCEYTRVSYLRQLKRYDVNDVEIEDGLTHLTVIFFKVYSSAVVVAFILLLSVLMFCAVTLVYMRLLHQSYKT